MDDPRPAMSVLKVIQKFLEPFFFTLCLDFDIPIRTISDPSCQRNLLCSLNYEVTKSDSLYATSHSNMNAHRSKSLALPIYEFGKWKIDLRGWNGWCMQKG